MSSAVFLVTGAMGCIGSWVLRSLMLRGTPALALDMSDDRRRIHQVIGQLDPPGITFEQADIADLERLRFLAQRHEVTHIVHLAGLQVPFCKADPPQGARVNVQGTINIFEVARQLQSQVRGLAYASSIAVLGPPAFYSDYPLVDRVPLNPGTLYGTYKQANESGAGIYWEDWGIGSVGLRPFIVFGVGRDQGLTSDIAKAILAAAASVEYEIKFGGEVALQYAPDVADTFNRSALAEYKGAAACNLRGDVVEVTRFIDILQEELPGARITCRADQPLPFPADLDDQGVRGIVKELPHTLLRSAIRETADRFGSLLQDDLIDLKQLDH